jgi:hypothetical protein
MGITKIFGTGTATPFPVSATVALGVSGSFEVIVRVAVFDPVEDGLNATVTMQLPPAPTVSVALPQKEVFPIVALDDRFTSETVRVSVPPAVLVLPGVVLRVKLAVEDSAMAEMLRAAPPELIMITPKAGEELPTDKLPKL